MTRPSPMDPRAERSITALQSTLAEFVKTAPRSEIDISMLCRAAGLHRTTFYKHFDSVPDLAASLLTDLMASIDCPSARLERRFASWLIAIRDQAAANRRTYRHLLTSDGFRELTRAVCDRLTLRIGKAVDAAAARGYSVGMDPRALTAIMGFGTFGLIEAVIADKDVDIPDTVDAFLENLPEPLLPTLVA